MSEQPLTARIAVRAVEYAGLAALVGGTFFAVVVGVGAALRLATPHAGLTLAAALLLAFSFEPARYRLRRLANRLVYGHRSSPWEAVSRLSVQMGHDQDPDALLDELAEVVRAGTGAAQVAVWLRVGTTWTLTAGSPEPGGMDPIPFGGEEVPPLGADLTVPIRHAGELLGAISVAKSGSGSLLELERRLVSDLASHAAIVTRSLHLRESLRFRLDLSRRQQAELLASRAQIVAVQDQERRRLERDLHDTCQQQAVVLAGRLGLARALAHGDPSEVRAVLEEARGDVDRLASALRRLTTAAPVPVLVDGGTAAALREETAALPMTVEVEDLTGRRHDPAIEAAVYFCCMEAIQNAIKHADASRITVRLSEVDGSLHCRIRDDGVGFVVEHAGAGRGLHNMRQRLEPLDGRMVIRSSPAGTEVDAEIPIPPGEATS